MLPEAFLARMQEQLKEEYEEFVLSYERTRYRALRLNPGKFAGEISFFPEEWELTPVEWEPDGYYYNAENGSAPGKHPYHEAGIYYIQEPSAMLPGRLLETKPGEKVLDLCSAPGGKGTKMAIDLKDSGLAVLNEIHEKRARILSENVERMGIGNALVVNETPETLAKRFPCFFDRIMVDAPCSGEGMFVKNADEESKAWSPENVLMCAGRQGEILRFAYEMLKPGGKLVYSTCTFAREEDEGAVEQFIADCPEMVVDGMHRLWPHKVKGEGHFAAELHKSEEAECRFGKQKFENGSKPGKLPEVLAFLTENIRDEACLRHLTEGKYVLFGEQVYLLPEECPELKGLRVLRPGLHLGTLRKNRFEPSHALALYLAPNRVARSLSLASGDAKLAAYLRGEAFRTEEPLEDGWTLLCVDGYSIGWGKVSSSTVKNHYPKGLRK